jgi:hypothetical protein
VPLPSTGTVEVNTPSPTHSTSDEAKTVKVIVPVGLNPPARTAVSVAWPPRATCPGARVEIVGAAGAALQLSTKLPVGSSPRPPLSAANPSLGPSVPTVTKPSTAMR